ncbi:excalibur calcium-binding domain-containing protein [Luteimonas cucumeris]|uniref:excalibur calcium-binding domain-containing protein n=1 Tax=Luteimonas cucumeris TaxID=985012 RepID=UPI0011A276CD
MRPIGSISLFVVFSLAASNVAGAHGGGLDKHGCHTNRKTGEYHCHRGAGAAPAPRAGYAPADRPAPSRVAPARNSAATEVFANCTEARAAGAAPVHRGDPGYGAHLDRDNDGVGCEPYRGRR